MGLDGLFNQLPSDPMLTDKNESCLKEIERASERASELMELTGLPRDCLAEVLERLMDSNPPGALAFARTCKYVMDVFREVLRHKFRGADNYHKFSILRSFGCKLWQQAAATWIPAGGVVSRITSHHLRVLVSICRKEEYSIIEALADHFGFTRLWVMLMTQANVQEGTGNWKCSEELKCAASILLLRYQATTACPSTSVLSS